MKQFDYEVKLTHVGNLEAKTKPEAIEMIKSEFKENDDIDLVDSEIKCEEVEAHETPSGIVKVPKGMSVVEFNARKQNE